MKHIYYKLKNEGSKQEAVDRVCINCGKREPSTIPISPFGRRPNTTPTVPNTFTTPGSKWGCRLGNHKMYYEYELEERR